jgi:hypothetical protein
MSRRIIGGGMTGLATGMVSGFKVLERPRLDTAGIRAWSCGPRSLKSPRVSLAIARLARHLRSTRVRLLHSFDFYSNALGVIAARLARVRVVI